MQALSAGALLPAAPAWTPLPAAPSAPDPALDDPALDPVPPEPALCGCEVEPPGAVFDAVARLANACGECAGAAPQPATDPRSPEPIVQTNALQPHLLISRRWPQALSSAQAGRSFVWNASDRIQPRASERALESNRLMEPSESRANHEGFERSSDLRRAARGRRLAARASRWASARTCWVSSAGSSTSNS